MQIQATASSAVEEYGELCSRPQRQSKGTEIALNKKILIVRNDSEDAKALSFLLAGTGYQISAHTSAAKAIETAKHERFDLVITDTEIPENQKDLGFVSDLKESQPSLPVFLLSDRLNLESIIGSIRAGVTDIIDQPNDLKGVFEATNSFFHKEGQLEEDVSWEDMIEVEKALAKLFRDPSEDSEGDDDSASQRELEESVSALKAAQEEVSELVAKLEASESKREKAESLLEDIRSGEGEGSGDSAENFERSAELDAREKQLEERASRVAKQRAEIEILMADLEDREFELQNAPQAPSGPVADDSELQQQLQDANAQRLDLQAQLHDLQHQLESAKANGANSEKAEQEISSLRGQLQDAKEAVVEKDFLLDQKAKELSSLQNEAENFASKTDLEELEEQKRLLEVERFKLQEKVDAFEVEKRTFDDDHGKRQREINVEKRDAEISLRELQTQIKEEQLKLQVEQANLKEEMRQFEQARQNFQEDVQDLQSKQQELKSLEESLRRQQETLAEQRQTASLPGTSPLQEIPEGKPEDNDPSSSSPPQGAPEPPAPNALEDKKDPDSWSKPPFNKPSSGRGPLRIGRKSS